MKWAFWLSLVLIGLTYLGYPAWLNLRRLWRTIPVHSGPITPLVSIIMAVHNEGAILKQKLQNLSELDYPSDRCEIIVVSDGSSDNTNQILANCVGGRWRAVICERHEGKAAALNRGIREAQGEIIFFTDARQMVGPNALRHLVRSFADPAVGCVSGQLVLQACRGRASSNSLGMYWDLEKRMRRWESGTGSVVGATGAIYAVRKNLLAPLPVETILDDVLIPLRVARSGGRVIFEPRALAFDRLGSAHREFRRKVRTLAGNYQLLQLAPWLLTPSNPVLYEYVCHKLLRLLAPFALLGLLISSLFLHCGIYKLAVLVQIIIYALALVAVFRPRLGIISRLSDASLAFVILNAAALVAFTCFIARKKSVWVGQERQC